MIADLMKKDGCYLSITGDEVMVNRVVGDPVAEEVELLPVAGPSGLVRHDPAAQTPAPAVMINRKKGSSTSCIMMHKLKMNVRPGSRSDLDQEGAEEKVMLRGQEGSPSEVSEIKGSVGIEDQESEGRGSSSLTKLLTPESRMQLRHVIRDFGTSFLLIMSGLVVIYDKENWSSVSDMADAVLAMFAVVLLYLTIYPTMKQSGYILLQTIPKHIDVLLLKQNLVQEFKHSVLSVHDLHVWCLTSSTIIATCHVTFKRSSMSSYPLISSSIEKFFAREGISSATIQPEFVEESEFHSNSHPCLYKCSNTELDCQELRCCHETVDECEAVICAGSGTAA